MQKTKLLLNILALFLCILPAVSMAQGGGNVTVSGIVTSADDKQPLIGVNVISGATSGVSTLADGTYRITVSAGTTLTFQYIGYKPFEFTVPAGRSSVTCDVALQGDSQTLDDVVVIAYGVRKKGTIAGSVSTVKAEKIEDTPAAAFDQALQGQVPGLTVLSDSGEPSETAAMAIRGTTRSTPAPRRSTFWTASPFRAGISTPSTPPTSRAFRSSKTLRPPPYTVRARPTA